MLEANSQLHPQILDSLIFHMKEIQLRGFHAADSQRWDKLATDLSRIGVSKTASDALISWANSLAEKSLTMPPKMRMLHPMEKEFISPEAYVYLLELFQLGMVNAGQLEHMIESSAFLCALPARKEHLQKMVMRLFSDQLESQGLNISH